MPASSSKRAPKFEVERLTQIQGKVTFYKLLKDDVCFFDEFQQQIKDDGNHVSELISAFSLMDQVAKLRHLPGTKYHPLGESFTYTSNGKACRARNHEIKTKNLRVYLCHLDDPAGKVVVMAGHKNTQAADIAAFENLVLQYLSTL
ncbi:hypothetical protein [Hymenobacter profundi]|uniref:Addiction module toxin RelE n=1 Tax=Hymenobacter profundi TaxID=1982110 RepID=A0ABS6WZ79_9BACT|nr:hypothetical protein [Hymenobacter profundi]MBW3128871.1 hypothetical protein [Hymenobacter profundi]